MTLKLRTHQPKPPLLARSAPATRRDAERERDRRRHKGDNLRKLYRRKRWKELRKVIGLRDRMKCRQTGVQLTMTKNRPNSLVVDHIRKPEGDLALFWDPANLQAVAKAWHDSEKQKQEAAEQRQGAV